MNTSYDNSSAVVVLPPLSGGRLRNRTLRTWLAKSNLRRETEVTELLARVLGVLECPYPQQGLGALRMWGQTGDQPTHWIAAADPVYLEPRLDHLCLHALRRSGVPATQMRELVDHLQSTLSSAEQFGFVRLGSYSYISAKSPLATACVPPYVLDQRVPNDFLPSGEDAAAHRNLISEIEMSLHEHDVNRRRIAQGQPPVNSLWLWGGGIAPQPEARAMPALFSDDALLTGYWYSVSATAEPWFGTITACIEKCGGGFVAETPEFDDTPELLENCLTELQRALNTGRLRRLTLLFRDGIRADVRRAHSLRVWRRDSDLFD